MFIRDDFEPPMERNSAMRAGILCARQVGLAVFVVLGAYASMALAGSFKEYPPNEVEAAKLYAWDNIVQIQVKMRADYWQALKTEEPYWVGPQGAERGVGAECQRTRVDGNGESMWDVYDWRDTVEVQIWGSGNSNPSPRTYAKGIVQIKKKSNCGSLTTGADQKPSIKLRFNSQVARDTMGLQYLDLNNSRQDNSYIRQTLGYYLYGLAGVPHPRANYAHVLMKLTAADEATVLSTENLAYVNVEPLRGSFIMNSDNKFTNSVVTQNGSDARAPGQLYELELGDDFNGDIMSFVGPEKVSALQGSSTCRNDLQYAVTHLNDPTVVNKVQAFGDAFNAADFAKFWAMEWILRNGDGYLLHRNNVFIYNDVAATSSAASPTTVDFKFIPWGIDGILFPGHNFQTSSASTIGSIVVNNPDRYSDFVTAVTSLSENVFTHANLEGAFKTRIDHLQSQLQTMGVDALLNSANLSLTDEINAVRTALNVTRAGALGLRSGLAGTLPLGESYYITDNTTGEVLHASTSEMVPNQPYYEVYHHTPPNNSTDRWWYGWNEGSTFSSEAYSGRNLVGSPDLLTTAGHHYIFQVPPDAPMPGAPSFSYMEWNLLWQGNLGDFPGTALLENRGTGGYLHFSASSDMTPNGRYRAYLGEPGDTAIATSLLIY
jgi:hypothetical protein